MTMTQLRVTNWNTHFHSARLFKSVSDNIYQLEHSLSLCVFNNVDIILLNHGGHQKVRWITMLEQDLSHKYIWTDDSKV